MPQRTVYCEDAVIWLEKHEPLAGCSILASLPDISEFRGYSFEKWSGWFTSTAALCLSRTAHDGVTIFYQSDIFHNGSWVDKAYLVQKAAETQGHRLLWHKIGCRFQAGKATFGRPGYTHILCFAKSVLPEFTNSIPDVLPEIGKKTWERGMGKIACQVIASFILNQVKSHTVIHPFCGQGSMLAAANAAGLNAIGIERSPKRAQIARELEWSAE